MPPYRNYYRQRWKTYRRRPRWFRRRYTRKNPKRQIYRRRRKVKRKFKRNYRKKKLKLYIQQFQPDRIRKCRIQGMFSLFQAGWGRYSSNYEMYRESIVPEKQPGGGGWTIFKISLNDLYKENQQLLNWWTKSNKEYNLCRYLGCKLSFYRQQDTDYVVNYQLSYPFEVTKFHYPSSHPERLLMYNHKIIVPSFTTSPHLRKTKITKRLKPPKEFLNKWYFQNQFCRHGLVMITAAACSLNNYFIDPGAQSNNIELFTINTDVFSHKNFKENEHQYFGYVPNSQYYMYASLQPTSPKTTQLYYLGNTNHYDVQKPSPNGGILGTSNYNYEQWSNPFSPDILNGDYYIYISNLQPTVTLPGSDKQAENITHLTKPLIQKCRYNPFKDKGDGNVAKWLNINTLERDWETDAGPEFTITGFPLWILLWGWEDWTRKRGKPQNLDTDYVLVIHTKYITPQMKAYVFVSENFTLGTPPYNNNKQDITEQQSKSWHPCWQYQKEAIENILMCGPAVCRNQGQIQAHLRYSFYFKWGGAPQYMEHVYDPCSQPDYPIPNQRLQGPEIENPTNDPSKDLYNFDFRRHLITQKAAKRISTDSKTFLSMFTDGVPDQPTFEVPIQKQKKKKDQTQTQKKEKATLEQQLQFYRHRRQQLRQRYNQLTKQLLNTELETANSE